MQPPARTHVVLVHVEVVGDAAAFEAAWRAWIAEHLEDATGLVGAAVHREQTGRRLLLISRWARPAAFETWQRSDAARSLDGLFDEHAVRSATSRWDLAEDRA